MRGHRNWTWAGALAVLVGFGVMAVWFAPIAPPLRTVTAAPPGEGQLTLPLAVGSLRFAVMGDVGRGDARQYGTAAEMARWHQRFPFEFVLMLGDNIYGTGTPEDYALKFARPYEALLRERVAFHAAVGNHDPPNIVTYPDFGMNGQRYYTMRKVAGPPWSPRRVAFFAIDTVTMDAGEMAWLQRELEESDADWKIAFYHHPLYTSGRYRMTARLTRWRLEPLFIQTGVDVGFSGHEHFYERIVPQHGIQYFTSGGGGALRPGDLRPSPVLAAGYDRDTHFILVEISRDTLHYQAISRTGQTVDHGQVARHAADRALPELHP